MGYRPSPGRSSYKIKVLPVIVNFKPTFDKYVNQRFSDYFQFAVRQLAANCVHILVHPPFNWNPDRRNVLGSSALDLAMRNRNAYLPVVWSLAFASSETVPEPSAENFSLTHLLLRPPTTDLSFNQVTADFEKYNFVLKIVIVGEKIPSSYPAFHIHSGQRGFILEPLSRTPFIVIQSTEYVPVNL